MEQERDDYADRDLPPELSPPWVWELVGVLIAVAVLVAVVLYQSILRGP